LEYLREGTRLPQARDAADREHLEFISPQLATLVDHPPPRAGWIHEVKHDGYRTLLVIERRKASIGANAIRAKADKHTLTYAGAAFIGLRGDEWHDLRERLKQNAIARSPLPGLRMKDAQWVEPKLTAKVRHLAPG
jgi:ATP-dependent DNA ligase